MSTVKVTTCKKDSQAIIGQSTNNPDYGYIRVEANDGLSFGNGGWLNSNTRTALIKGKVADLKAFIVKNNVSLGYELAGKIVIKEQTEAFYEGQQPKIVPSTGEVLYVTINGVKNPIYRQTEFTMDMTQQDTLVKHENVLSGASKAIQANDIAIG